MPDEPIRPRPSRYRWLVFALLSFAYLLVYFHRLCPAVVALDLMQDLQAGAGLMGLLGAAYFYPYAFMQLPAGLLSDSWGPRRSITLFFTLAGAASIFFGLAQGAGWAIFARVLVGLGISMVFVPTMKVLTRWFRISEFAMMTGLLMAVGGVGILCAAAPLAYMSMAVGWRTSFVIIGVVTLVCAAAIWFFVRNSPEEMGLPAAEPPSTGPQEPAAKIALWQGVRMVLGSARFWPLGVWFFFSTGAFFTFGGLWGGPYLMQAYGLSKPEAGNILSMLAIAVILGSPLLTYLSDKIFRSRKKLLIWCSVLLALLLGPVAFFPIAMPVGLFYPWCLLFSLCSGASVVIGFTSAKELYPVEMAGTSVGLINLFPFMGGAVLQPVLGLILEAHGEAGGVFPPQAYGRAFMVLFLGSLVALACSFFVKESFYASGQK
ncbi:MAG: MFS transporter [Desulfarculaceae bacterium]|jgi:sugar phosphate permease